MCWASPRSLRSPLYANSISALDIELLACQSLNSHSCLCQSAPTPLADVCCWSQLLSNFHIQDLTVALTRLLNPIRTAWAFPSFSHLHKSVETNHSALTHNQKAFLSRRGCYYYFSANSNPTRLLGLGSSLPPSTIPELSDPLPTSTWRSGTMPYPFSVSLLKVVIIVGDQQ